MKKFVLCLGIFCSLEAYAAGIEESIDLIEKGLSHFSEQPRTCIAAFDNKADVIQMENGKKVIVRFIGDNIIIDQGKKCRKQDYLYSIITPEKEVREDMKTFFVDFCQKLLERDPKAISQAAGVIVVIYGVMKFFL